MTTSPYEDASDADAAHVEQIHERLRCRFTLRDIALVLKISAEILDEQAKTVSPERDTPVSSDPVAPRGRKIR